MASKIRLDKHHPVQDTLVQFDDQDSVLSTVTKVDKRKSGLHRRPTGRLPEACKPYRFRKGQSGNPNGRPKKEFCIPDIIRAQATLPIPVSYRKFFSVHYETALVNKLNLRSAMVLRCWLDAVQGDKDAREFIALRSEGKPRDASLDETTESTQELIRALKGYADHLERADTDTAETP